VRTSARPLIDALRNRPTPIPVAVVGKTSLLARPEMALIARLFVLWAGGVWYPNPQFEPEAVTRESLVDEVRSVCGVVGQEAGRRDLPHPTEGFPRAIRRPCCRGDARYITRWPERRPGDDDPPSQRLGVPDRLRAGSHRGEVPLIPDRTVASLVHPRSSLRPGP